MQSLPGYMSYPDLRARYATVARTTRGEIPTPLKPRVAARLKKFFEWETMNKTYKIETPKIRRGRNNIIT